MAILCCCLVITGPLCDQSGGALAYVRMRSWACQQLGAIELERPHGIVKLEMLVLVCGARLVIGGNDCVLFRDNEAAVHGVSPR